ncbi:cell surface protein, partial [Lactiplantibacillus plantarum subsp. plantarum]|nr:cell surface protein [Lactiplantibacillus plantarum subsp. plantarum]
MRNRRVKWLLILVFGILGLLNLLPLEGNAATLTSKMTDVKANAAFQAVPGGNSVGSNVDNGLQAYPALGNVSANYADNGRITRQTTQITMTMTGSITLKSSNSMSKAYFDIMAGPASGSYTGATLVTATPTSLGSGNSIMISSSKQTQTLSVNFQN